MGGRPTKFTPEIRRRIVKGVKMGLSYRQAAFRASISERCLQYWLATGREDEEADRDTEHRAFLRAIHKAESDNAYERLKRIDKAGEEGDWKADAWVLERRHGFTNRQSMELTGKNGGPVQTTSTIVFDFSNATNEQLAEAKKALAAKAKETP